MADNGGTHWLTYAELAAALGIKRESAIRLVRRKPWPKRHSNDPVGIRVGVPADALADVAAHRPPPDRAPDKPPDNRIETLQAAVASLEGQLERERGRADRAEARADHIESAAAERETWLRSQVEILTAAMATRHKPVPWRDMLTWLPLRKRPE